MAPRSRLRTREGKRRWLVVVPVILACTGGLVFLITSGYLEVPDSLRRTLLFSTRLDQDLPRGIIYDRSYKELAVSYERVSVYVNVREIEGIGAIVTPLTSILEESEEDLRKRLEGDTLRLWLARDITQEQEDAIKALDLKGVFLHREHVRYYPNQEIGAHLVGFVEEDTGLSGVEYYLNSLQTTYRIGEQQAQKLTKLEESQPGTDGQHLILTLDLRIQRLLEDYLSSLELDAENRRYGVMVMEASSGAIIGYAQKPSFDPNRFQIFPQNNFVDLFNQPMALPDELKIYFRDLSLLESQYSEETANLPWSITAEDRQLGVQLQLWEKLGTGKGQRYDFVSEPPELSNRVAKDQTGTMHRDFETVPVLLTPLQIVTAVARSFYDGSTITPHVADRYVLRKNQSEFLLEDLELEMSGNNLQPGVSAEVAKLLSAQGKKGSGPLDTLTVGGESISYTSVNKKKIFTNHRMKLGLHPAQNPELIFFGLVSENGYRVLQRNLSRFEQTFEDIYAPVVARQNVIKHLMSMMEPRELKTRNLRGGGGPGGEPQVIPTGGTKRKPLFITKMPDLTGLSLRKSLRILQGTGVTVTVKGSGRVVRQEPEPGTVLVSGATVIIELQPDRVELKAEK